MVFRRASISLHVGTRGCKKKSGSAWASHNVDDGSVILAGDLNRALSKPLSCGSLCPPEPWLFSRV